MTRPTTHDDLPDYYRAGHPIATVTAAHLVDYPSLGQHLLAALAEAKTLGLTVKDGEITVPKTDVELDEHLAWLQRLWDVNAADYALACAGERDKFAKDYHRRAVDKWAQAECRPAIDWNEQQVSA